jgi:hypothetical protein
VMLVQDMLCSAQNTIIKSRSSGSVVKYSQKQLIYSVRVSISYRILGLLESDHIYCHWISAHDECDELLKPM